jgi:hypothetical protein
MDIYLGSPPIWRNTPVPFNLISDREVLKDLEPSENSARHDQQMVLLAITAAITSCTPSFSFSTADIIADRNSLRNLLRWVENFENLYDFRMDLQVAGTKTLVITRFAVQTQTGSTPKSFGLSYERHETRAAPGFETASKARHNRLISYVSPPAIRRYALYTSEISRIGLRWLAVRCAKCRERNVGQATRVTVGQPKPKRLGAHPGRFPFSSAT